MYNNIYKRRHCLRFRDLPPLPLPLPHKESIFPDEIAAVSYLGILKMSSKAISLFNWRTGLDISLITATVRETVKAFTL